jgi:Tfp pilus assembly protein PilX
MHNLALTVLLAEHKRSQCPCGAVAERRSGLCRKCHDRNAWRRKTTSTHRRKATRRRTGRRSRNASWLHTELTTRMEG